MATALELCGRLEAATGEMRQLAAVLSSKHSHDIEHALQTAAVVYTSKEQAATRLRAQLAALQNDIAAVRSLCDTVATSCHEVRVIAESARRAALSTSTQRDFFNVVGGEPLAAMMRDYRSFLDDPSAATAGNGVTGMATYDFPICELSTAPEAAPLKEEPTE